MCSVETLGNNYAHSHWRGETLQLPPMYNVV
jgi:hypothetical protein